MPSKLRAIILSIFCTSFTAAALPGTAQWPEMVRNRYYVFVRPVLDYDQVFDEVGEVADINEDHFLNEQEPQALKTAYMIGNQPISWMVPEKPETQMTKRNLHQHWKDSRELNTWPEMKRGPGPWSRLKKDHLQDQIQ